MDYIAHGPDLLHMWSIANEMRFVKIQKQKSLAKQLLLFTYSDYIYVCIRDAFVFPWKQRCSTIGFYYKLADIGNTICCTIEFIMVVKYLSPTGCKNANLWSSVVINIVAILNNTQYKSQ